MQVNQRRWLPGEGWSPPSSAPLGATAGLVLVFGDTALLADPYPLAALRELYPEALQVGCSTAGEILGTCVLDGSLVASAVAFASTRVRGVVLPLCDAGESSQVGAQLAAGLAGPGLAHVLVFSDGLWVNGSQLVRGLTSGLPPGVAVSGGLAGDGSRFQRTLVGLGGAPRERQVVGVGLYGTTLRIGCCSLGGWDPFGPERRITRSCDNVLYELDGQSALGLYKQYLGPHAAGLPASGLHFPLSLRSGGAMPVVRTILSVDEEADSVTFAGDLPEGAYARLMKCNVERLIDGAHDAAEACRRPAPGGRTPELALLISCVGRKLVLQQRIEEEVESVREVLGEATALAGFYSYGEIAPFIAGAVCELHNQTMTITTLAED